MVAYRDARELSTLAGDSKMAEKVAGVLNTLKSSSIWNINDTTQQLLESYFFNDDDGDDLEDTPSGKYAHENNEFFFINKQKQNR